MASASIDADMSARASDGIRSLRYIFCFDLTLTHVLCGLPRSSSAFFKLDDEQGR
jgi:hypothetical protein